MAARKSGLRLETPDIPLVLGMINRNDRRHDIAAWFGVNQGRIKDAQDGKYGKPAPAGPKGLPPRGPPGIKGRHLRDEVNEALHLIAKGDAATARAILQAGANVYDADER